MDGLKMKYFVLNPTKDDAYGHASRQAMRAYAKCIMPENEKLAEDLFQWASDAETESGGSEESKNATDTCTCKDPDIVGAGSCYPYCEKCGKRERRRF